MKDELFFYVIVASKNAGEKLRETVQNALVQSYERLNVIVQDALSDDGGVDALKAIADGRLHVAREKDDGIYDAMNKGIEAALALETRRAGGVFAGRAYALFLNCGDRFFDGDVCKTAARRIATLNRRVSVGARVAPDAYAVGVAYGDTYERKTKQIVAANPKIDDFACYRNLPCHQSTFYDLFLLRENRYNTDWKVRADYEHFLRLKYRAHAQPKYLRMTIANYEGGGFSETKENVGVSEAERKEIIAQYLPKEKILRYDLYRALTLQPVRQRLASNEATAKAYQTIKRMFYR